MKKFSLLLLLVLFLFSCASPPASFIKTFDEPGVWRTIEVRDGLEKEEMWQTIVDAISQKFDLEVIDKDSGYLRTSWKYTFIQRGTISDKYRSRIVIKFLKNWETLQIKSEAHWLDRGGWVLGYDSIVLEDAFGDIQGRIGRIRR